MTKSIAAICMLASILACTGGHQQSETGFQSIAVVTIVDTSDTMLLGPLPDPILKLFQYENNPNAEFQFSLGFLTDKIHNQTYGVHLGNGQSQGMNKVSNDPQFRDQNMYAFHQRVRTIIKAHVPNLEQLRTLPQSECLRGICLQITDQLKLGYQKIYVVAFTNLFEHSMLFNSYSDSIKVDKIENIVVAHNLLPDDLSMVSLTIVFNPKNSREDKRFERIVHCWRRVFETRKARFHVQSNNESFHL